MGRSKKLVTRVLAPVAALSAASMALVACSSEGEITVGSKEFTEQHILGQMMVIALEDAGYDVNDETGLQGTSVVRNALEAGDVDLYWEYTGTAWGEILGNDDLISDPTELYNS